MQKTAVTPYLKNLLYGLIAFSLVLTVAPKASAHVTVKPAEALTGAFQTFTVNVPNEKTIPTTSVKVIVPPGVEHVTPTNKAGWTIAIDKSGEGKAATVTAVTWSGGEITDGTRDEFTFSAKTPAEAGELQWKAYQTYSDGTVVAWDQAESQDSGHSSENPNQGPLSITKVSSTLATNIRTTTTNSNDNKKNDYALYLSGAALLVSFIAIIITTRKRQ